MIFELVYGDMIVWMERNSPTSVRYEIYPNKDAQRQRLSIPHLAPSLVSRQFWADASEVFIRKATFEFMGAESFRILAVEEFHLACRIRRMQFFCVISSRERALQGRNTNLLSLWASVLTPSLVGRYQRLRGVQLNVYLDGRRRSLSGIVDVMTDANCRAIRLPDNLRSLQQHGLHHRFNNVTVDSSPPEEPPRDCEPIRRAVLTQLSVHRPRRYDLRLRNN